MTREEQLLLRDILLDFQKGAVPLDYVEAHVACLIEEASDTHGHKALLREALRERPALQEGVR